MTYKLIINAGLICCFVFSAFAQNRSGNIDTRKNTHVDEKKPAVYTEFVKLEKRSETINYALTSESAPILKTEEYEAVLMRVTNNSRWAIQFQVHFDDLFPKLELKPLQDKRLVFTPSSNAEVELEYGVEQISSQTLITAKLRLKVPYTKVYSHTTDLWLFSGQSVIYVVKREELRRNLQIYLRFRYEWETSEKNRGYEEPEHRVKFDWGDFEKAAGI